MSAMDFFLVTVACFLWLLMVPLVAILLTAGYYGAREIIDAVRRKRVVPVSPNVVAEMMNRYCLGIELNPAYVDVAVERWQAFAKAEATLAGDGRTYEEIAKARKKAPAKKAGTSTLRGIKAKKSARRQLAAE